MQKLKTNNQYPIDTKGGVNLQTSFIRKAAGFGQVMKGQLLALSLFVFDLPRITIKIRDTVKHKIHTEKILNIGASQTVLI